MSTKAVTRLAKPQMRGLLTDQIRRNLATAIVLSVGTMLSCKFLLTDVRKKTYAEFYRNYDVDKEFEKMREAGVFTSARPKSA